jgi:hypothetical protein
MSERTYQGDVATWMQQCFGVEGATDKQTRNFRFIEEALELVQALGCTREDAQRLVAYVYDRPAGTARQEVGGVMVTLAGLCYANNIDLNQAASAELDRITMPEVMEKIRQKQANKPKNSPLPQSVAPAPNPLAKDHGEQ